MTKLPKLIFGLFLAIVSVNAKAETILQKCLDNQATIEPEICLKIQFDRTPNTKESSAFSVEFISKNQNEVDNVSIDLWMQMGEHGHGSAPVEIMTIAPNHYIVTDAWFVMVGDWQIRLQFDVSGARHKIEVPVKIE